MADSHITKLDGATHGLPTGLPNAHYTDPDTYARECRAVLAGSWASIGFGKDIPNPGDARPVDFMGEPLLIVRGRDGEVRVFENVCRHRGMRLVDEPTTFKTTVRCPYHSWCYGFDGALKTTPHVGGPGVHSHPDVDKDKLGLIAVRSHVWLDVIFVNMSGEAPSFEDYIAPLRKRWAEFADREVTFGGPDSAFSLDVNCNWKFAVENYCESYHLPWVHPALNRYSKLEDHYEIIDDGGDFSGQGTTVYNPQLGDDGRALAPFTDLSDHWDTGAEYIALYPNTLLGVHKDHTFAIQIEPVSMTQSREHIVIYYADPKMADDDWRDLREANAAMWKTVFLEDVFAVEGMQKGRAASGFDGGVLSPVMDRPTRTFHEWVKQKVSAD